MTRFGATRRGLVVVGVVLAAWLAPATVLAQATVTIDAGARVTKVDGTRITIDRGAKAGLTIGRTGGIFPVGPREGVTAETVDLDVRLAVGRVVEVKDDRATLTLDAVTGTIAVGAFFEYELDVSPDLAESSLVRILARGVDLTSAVNDRPFVTFEALLADRSRTAGGKALDAMVAEMKAMRRTLADALQDPVSSGTYQGKRVGAIIDGLDRAQLVAFTEYMDAFAGSYIGQRWMVPTTFLTWVYIGAPSGDSHRQRRAVQARVKNALASLRAGKLDDARATYTAILEAWPEAPDVRDMVTRIDRVLMLQRAVESDADDTASEIALMHELYELGANEAALLHVGPLKRRNFDAARLGREQGLALAALERWAEAKDVFEALTKLVGTSDTEIASWTLLARAQAKAASAPTDIAIRLELAAVQLAQEEWDNAVATYRRVLDDKAATAKQRATAAKGQDNVATGKQLDLLLGWTLEDIQQHNLGDARDRLVSVLRLADRLGDPARASAVLQQLARRAQTVDEQELAIELMRKRIDRVPADPAAWSALAFALLETDRLDEAEATAKQALRLVDPRPRRTHARQPRRCRQARDESGR